MTITPKALALVWGFVEGRFAIQHTAGARVQKVKSPEIKNGEEYKFKTHLKLKELKISALLT